MKRTSVVKLLTVALTLVLSFGSAASAAESQSARLPEEKTILMKIDGGLTIEKFSDGRVKGIENADKLNKLQKKEILKQMKFSDEEIEKYPAALIDDIIAKGGVKVQLEHKNYSHTYTSLDGVEYIVNEQNKDLVDKVKAADAKKLGLSTEASSQISPMAMGGESEGVFSGYGTLLFHGKVNNNKEYSYSMTTSFSWDSFAWAFHTDTLAIAYETNATRTGASGRHYFNSRPTTDVGVNIDYSSVYGLKGKTISSNDSKGSHGYLMATVNIPVSEDGNAGMFTSGYGHAWTVVPFSVSIGPVSVDFNGVGDSWTWDNYFTIGKAY